MPDSKVKRAIPSGDKTALQLLARGDCYNPQCTERLITSRSGRPIVNFEIAHIRDELPPADPNAAIGWRYWPENDLTQEQRNHFTNLILLCGPCHKLIDKIAPRDYSVELLHAWKSENESDREQLLSDAVGIVATAQEIRELEDRLVEKYVSEIYVALESHKKDLLNALDGGDTFPLAEFAIIGTTEIDCISPSYTAIGTDTLNNVSVRITIGTSTGSVSGFINDQVVPVLTPGESTHIWEHDPRVRRLDKNPVLRVLPVCVDWETLRHVNVSFWVGNRQYAQSVQYNPIVLGGNKQMAPTNVTVHRIHPDGTEQLLYHNEIIQIPDGRVCVTKDPVVR